MTSRIFFESSSAEKLLAEIITDSDPTSEAAPEFSITTGLRDDPGSWVAGSWVSGSWVEKTNRADAVSPVMGSGQALDVTEGNQYNLWMRWTIGGQTPVLLLGVIIVR